MHLNLKETFEKKSCAVLPDELQHSRQQMLVLRPYPLSTQHSDSSLLQTPATFCLRTSLSPAVCLAHIQVRELTPPVNSTQLVRDNSVAPYPRFLIPPQSILCELPSFLVSLTTLLHQRFLRETSPLLHLSSNPSLRVYFLEEANLRHGKLWARFQDN